MSASIADLIAVLEQKDRMMSELADALLAEEQCVVQLDMAGLEESVRRKEAVLAQLADAKSVCTALIPRAAGELGLERSASLRQVAEAVPGASGRRLQELRERLQHSGGNVERLLRQNGSLVYRSLDVVNKSMQLFSRLLKGPETYGASGRIVAAPGSAAFLCREI